MPRIERIDIGGYTYHILNRANSRAQIFDSTDDYLQFEKTLEEAVEKYDMQLLAYCIMPNHWHLVLCPRNDGDLKFFMNWLSNTHTRRWHIAKNTVGQGHLYQGRYKSFICQNDEYFLTLVRYVERNARKANLVPRAEQWRWSSVWRRESGSPQQRKLLAPWSVARSHDYLEWLNKPQSQTEEDALERSELKSVPFGSSTWTSRMVKKFDLEQTLRGVGRPKTKKT